MKKEAVVASKEQVAAAAVMVEGLIKGKKLTSYKKAAIEIGTHKEEDKWFASCSEQVVLAFETAMVGSSALITNASGKWAQSEKTENHPAFLLDNGYTNIPQFFVKPVRKASKDALKVAMYKELGLIKEAIGCTLVEAIAVYKITKAL